MYLIYSALPVVNAIKKLWLPHFYPPGNWGQFNHSFIIIYGVTVEIVKLTMPYLMGQNSARLKDDLKREVDLLNTKFSVVGTSLKLCSKMNSGSMTVSINAILDSFTAAVLQAGDITRYAAGEVPVILLADKITTIAKYALIGQLNRQVIGQVEHEINELDTKIKVLLFPNFKIDKIFRESYELNPDDGIGCLSAIPVLKYINGMV